METSDREFLIGIANEIRSTGEFRIAGAPELGREILALIHQKKTSHIPSHMQVFSTLMTCLKLELTTFKLIPPNLQSELATA